MPVFTVTYTGLVNGDLASATPPSVTTTATAASPVGSYVLTPSGASDNNYIFTYIDGVLTISKSDQTITFSALSDKTYGDSDFAAAATASSGLSVSLVSDNLSVASISGGVIHITGAGNAIITASQNGDGNYNPAPSVSRSLTVGKAALTFTAENKSKLYQAQNPVLTYSIAGFVNGETQSVLDVLPSIQTTALQNSTNGDYPITISGGSDNNYTYIYIPGILTITRLQQTITFSGFPEKLLVGDKYTLAAISSSGLTVQFESMDAALATVSGNELTGVSKGNVQVRAFHPGDLNWDAAEAFATVEIYSTHKDIMHLFTPNNDGFNDYWELPDLLTWGKCDVRVFNRWGKLVFADPDYNNLWDGTSNGSPLPEGPYYFIIDTENSGMVKGTVNIVR
ncbi:MAG: gliding motility-associated C-terminal domain-containing protein [Bacteroidales bacterium]|nr:gliding motility-associated C-terminal domain-containing protein [Bacteroidales bacterium]